MGNIMGGCIAAAKYTLKQKISVLNSVRASHRSWYGLRYSSFSGQSITVVKVLSMYCMSGIERLW